MAWCDLPHGRGVVARLRGLAPVVHARYAAGREPRAPRGTAGGGVAGVVNVARHIKHVTSQWGSLVL